MSEEKIEQKVGSGYSSHPQKTTLTAKQQEKLWGLHIRPVLKKCKLAIPSTFNNAVISEVDLYKMQMFICDFPTGLPYDENQNRPRTIEDVLRMISNGRRDDDLSNLVAQFIDDIKEAGKIPHLMAFFNRNYPAPEKAKKLRPNQKAKKACPAAAKKLWKINPNILIKNMADDYELKQIAGEFATSTRRDWVTIVAPEHLHKAGRREGT